MATTASFNSFSLTRLSMSAPAQPPNEAPIAVTIACSQCTSAEKTKIATAEALITPARMFFAAPALRTATPVMVSAAIIKSPMPPPKYPP